MMHFLLRLADILEACRPKSILTQVFVFCAAAGESKIADTGYRGFQLLDS